MADEQPKLPSKEEVLAAFDEHYQSMVAHTAAIAKEQEAIKERVAAKERFETAKKNWTILAARIVPK